MATYATWNASDAGSNVTLSGGNLTATHSGSSAWTGIRANQSSSSTKYYIEITATLITGPTTFNAYVGISTSSYTFGDPYTNAFVYAYNSYDGHISAAGTPSAYGAPYKTGDIIGMAVDMVDGTIIFYKNGVSQGTAATGISGTYFPTVMFYDSTASFTANFGATAFSYSVPSGYQAGLYTGGATTNGNFLTFM